MTLSFEDPSWPRASEWLGAASSLSSGADLVVLGAPLGRQSITPGRCDLAPDAIRAGLRRFTPFDLAHQHDLRELVVRDAGNLPIEQSTPEASYELVTAAVGRALATAEALVLLGGNNSITYPACCGMGRPLERCGLITLDAHLDLRHLKFGLLNGNPVRALLEKGLPADNIFQVGIQSFANSADYVADAVQAGIHVIPVETVAERGFSEIIRDSLCKLSAQTEAVYVDLDLDVMDRTFAPAATGSRPGGLTPRELRAAAYECGVHPAVRVLDIVELDPTRDRDDVTLLAAGACLLSFASGLLGRIRQEEEKGNVAL
jgi:arginase family enzyme